MTKPSTRPLVIKKYENRRLYNTVTSQYINQEQVAQLVREGHNVQVVDAATGEDITRLILAQIVLEDAKTPDSVFPLDVLRQMILASGRATQETSLRYMQSMMEIYQNAYRALPPALNPFELLQGRWAQPPAGNATAPVPQPPEHEAITNSRHVEELENRIAELESLLATKTSNKKKETATKKKSRRKS